MVPDFKKGHNVKLSEDKRYFNTKLAKIRIKSEHCIVLLKASFQHLHGHRRVIKDKKCLDAILILKMCACVLHDLFIEHPVPPDWFNDNVMELDQEE